MAKKLAVIGGGPKAAALSAKVDRMRDGGDTIELTVFEKSKWGAAWSGEHGYTDGKQHLCTPAERDVGFPYLEGVLDREQITELAQKNSWGSFLVSREGGDFREWVDRGRKSPTHNLYAQYIEWVIEACDVNRELAEVTAIRRENDKWIVTADGADYPDFDGVVITGPGPAKTGFTREADPRVTDGVEFWKSASKFLKAAGRSDEAIVIAGSGGTSAAIAAELAKHNSRNRPIFIIGSQAALFTRSESFFENSLYSDNDAWMAIEPKIRQQFTVRLNRGVVWANVSAELSNSPSVKFLPGRVDSLTITAPVEPSAPETGVINVNYTNNLGPASVPACLVVDAAGFDEWWFAGLLDPQTAGEMKGADEDATKTRRQTLMDTIKDDLSLDIAPEGLHVPMVSQTQGPGFGSLMVLGLMSDRILKSYQTED